jgi:hypothetical protein
MQALAVISLISTFGIFSLGATAQAEDANTRIAAMPYSECLSIIAETAQDMGEAPTQMINNDEETTVRFNASDGFVSVSCSRADKMVLTKSPVPEAAGMTAAR